MLRESQIHDLSTHDCQMDYFLASAYTLAWGINYTVDNWHAQIFDLSETYTAEHAYRSGLIIANQVLSGRGRMPLEDFEAKITREVRINASPRMREKLKRLPGCTIKVIREKSYARTSQGDIPPHIRRTFDLLNACLSESSAAHISMHTSNVCASSKHTRF